MDSTSIQNDKVQSALIKSEALQKEYEVTLQQYQEAGKNYINTLQNSTSNPCQNYNSDSTEISQECYDKIWSDQGCSTKAPNSTNDWTKSQTLDGLVNDSYLWATMTDDAHRQGCYDKSTNYTTKTSATFPSATNYVSLKGRSWWGTTSISEGNTTTQEECENMCSSSGNCTGATFNPVKKYCWTRSGDSKISVGTDNDYALIPNQKAALIIMKSLNDKLLLLNEQIANELKNVNPDVLQQTQDKKTKQQQLSVSYQRLLEQKMEMENQLH
jgi:hypothetical protein